MQLYEKLAWLRREKGISQLTAAEALKVSRQAISRWEVGTAVPTTDNLKYLSELYDIPVDVLLDDSQDIHAWRENQQNRITKSMGHRVSRQRRSELRRSWPWCWPSELEWVS
ncbi:helix-turn-helix transcriptional regulator [Pseudoflavonifractor sp. MCC625]|uniref:helix-turn-helix transcriptional regulator n=1 Tax=Pseudoflavonifractor sp. MCC625 TaxID=2592647 RepID=UPI001C024668|nr:helix-turn-helix transcriptional regulator [Pseudoflavonifractor sp. MCC625]MBT9685343.1 helix-turn-helix domain-containing protein [Pseudoflavonifractor sp. MCC625]